MKKRLAAAYCRVSTKPQLKGDGLRRQRDVCQEWCNENDYILGAIFQECGTDFRQHYPSALSVRELAVEFCNRSGAVLVFEAFDRFSRANRFPDCEWVSVWDGIKCVSEAKEAA